MRSCLVLSPSRRGEGAYGNLSFEKAPAAKTFGVKWRSEGRNGVSQHSSARPETPAAKAAGYGYEARLRGLTGLHMLNMFFHFGSQPTKVGFVIVACPL